MPMYTFNCPVCQRTEDAVVPMAERDAGSIRCYCLADLQAGQTYSTAMVRQASAPAGKVQGGTPKFHK